MRIKDIETVACNVPFKNHMKFHSGERIGATRVIVKLQSDEGITGLGETQHFQSKYVIDNVLKPAMIGEDPTNIERLRAKALIGRHLTGSLNRCWENDPWSYSGIEMAAYDLIGKSLGVPVYQLLGGLYRIKVPFVDYFYPTANRLSPGEIAEDCCSMLKELGGHTLEMKVGVNKPSGDVETIMAIRKAWGDELSIRIDANGGWNPSTAISTINEMERYRVSNVEEPSPGLAGMSIVRKSVRTPISTHNTQLREIVALAAADNIVGDILTEGGIHSLRELAVTSNALGLGFWMRGTHELGIGTAAILHLAASTPSMSYPNQTMLHLFADDIIKEPFKLKNGEIDVPRSPGLGVELDEGRVEKYSELFSTQGNNWYWGERLTTEWQPSELW